MLETKLQALLSPLVNSLGYELWACEYLPQGKYSLLRVLIDKEGGISLDDCSLVSLELSALLDVEDPIPGNYSLEVSSPGIPRPLFSSAHYARYVGHTVLLKLRTPIHGSKKLMAKIVSVSPTLVELELGETTIHVEFSEILKASLIGE